MNDHNDTTNLTEADGGHDTSANDNGMDRLEGEHEEIAIQELRVDVVTAAITRNNAGDDSLQGAGHLQCCRTTIGVSE